MHNGRHTHTQTHTHGSEKKTSHYRQQSRHGHARMNTQNSCMGTFAQNIVQTFHRKARARFETSYNAKLVQPPQLPTVGNWIRCIARVKTLESKKASHYRMDCRAPTKGARQKTATCRGPAKKKHCSEQNWCNHRRCQLLAT